MRNCTYTLSRIKSPGKPCLFLVLPESHFNCHPHIHHTEWPIDTAAVGHSLWYLFIMSDQFILYSRICATTKNKLHTFLYYFFHSHLVECCFMSTENIGLLGMGAQHGHIAFLTAPEHCHSQKMCPSVISLGDIIL